ncbi:MAG: hypothetical protein PHW63_07260 [Alphaproteobacteria bacterium]|nr:hypothetical protein [Alphaproteobacteria bacterium]
MRPRLSFTSIFKQVYIKAQIKRCGTVLFFLMLGLFSGALTVELGLRLVGYGCVSYLGYGPLQNALGIPEIGYGGRPYVEGIQSREGFSQLKLNRLGFHDIEHSPVKSPQTKRIAVFGNSFTMCAQVPTDACYVQQLETALNTCLKNEKVETVNYGVDGYSLEQSFLLLQKVLTENQPDLILLQVVLYPFNNELDTGSRKAPDIRFTQDGQPIVEAPFLHRTDYKMRASWIYTLFQKVSDHFRLLQYLNEYRRVAFVGKAKEQPEASDPVSRTHYWQTRFEVLEGLVKMTRAKGVPLFIVLTPAGGETETGDEPDIEKDGAIKWHEATARLNVPVLDVRKEFHAKSLADKTYYFGYGHESGQGHLNVYGNAVFANLLSSKLCPVLLTKGD